MNNQKLQRTDIAINLKEMMWNLLSQWKAILITALIMMVLVSGLDFLKSSHTYKAEMLLKEKTAEEPAEERIASVMEVLSEEEQQHVNYVLQEEEWLERQKDYLDQSMVMKTDPTRLRILKLVYEIDLSNSGNTGILSSLYYNYCYSEDFAKAIRPIIDPNMENKYIQELVYTSSDSRENQEAESEVNRLSMTMGVILPEDEDTEALSEAITQTLKEFCKKMNSRYTHTIELSNKEIIYQYSSDFVGRKTSLFNNINAMEKTVKTARATLTEEEREAVDTITAIRNEVKEKDDDPAAEDGEESEPKLSAKMAASGFVIGILLYAVAYVVIVIMRKKVNCAAEAETYTGARLVGEIYTQTEHKGIKNLAHSSFIDKKHYNGKTDTDKQVEKLWKTLSAICANGDVKNISLLDISGNSELSLDLTNKLMAESGNKGIEVTKLDLNEEIDETNMNNISDSLILTSDSTKAGTAIRLSELCRDYGVKCRGCVFAKNI